MDKMEQLYQGALRIAAGRVGNTLYYTGDIAQAQGDSYAGRLYRVAAYVNERRARREPWRRYA